MRFRSTFLVGQIHPSCSLPPMAAYIIPDSFRAEWMPQTVKEGQERQLRSGNTHDAQRKFRIA